MKKIIILGCGYLGYNIAMYFKEKTNVDVIGIKNIYTDKLDEKINFYERDFNNKDAFDEIDFKDAIVINAIGFLNATNKLTDYNFALQEFELLSKIIIKLNTLNIMKFIQLSSGGTVYGDKTGSINEDAALKPINLYGISKSFIENFLNANYYENGMHNCVIRVANPYGGYQLAEKQQGLIPIVLRNLITDKDLKLWARKNTIRDYIYIDDFLHGLEILIKNSIDNGVYNLGSGVGHSINDIIEISEKKVNKKLNVIYVEHNNAQIESNILDIDKIKKLGYRNLITLEEGIGKELIRIQKNI